MTPFIKNALSLLNSGRINEAIRYIRKRLIADRNSRGLDQLSQLEQTYKYLLKYLAEGQQDPERDRMFSNIRESLYSIVNAIRINSEQEESSALYHSISRSLKYSGVDFADALGRFISADAAIQLAGADSDAGKKYGIDRDRALKDIFSISWTLPIGDKESIKAMTNVAADNDISYELRSLIISALYLSLGYAYDRDKFIALIDIYIKSKDVRVKARSLTSIVLLLDLHAKRVQNDLEISLRFDTLNDTPGFQDNLLTVFFELVKARGGLNLLKKIETEILPDIIRESPKFIDKLKGDDGNIDIEKMSENSEWEGLISKKMERKFHKLTDLQSSGGDIMLSTFGNSISKFYYFNDIDSWFRTFEAEEAVRLGIPAQMAELWKEMPSYNSMCDLDKYVLALTFSRLPEMTKNMMADQLKAQIDQMKEELKDMEYKAEGNEFKTEAQNFARVIFRFYNYFRAKSEFKNPFDHAIDIFSLPFIGNLPDKDAIYETLSDFYFRQGFYNDAISCLEILEKTSVLDFPEYEKKIGYCYEKLYSMSDALTHYKAAYNSVVEDDWLLKKIYSLGVATRDYKLALEALEKLYDRDPDNTNNLINLIELHIKHPELTSAKDLDSLLAKAYYLKPDDPKVIRFMAANEGIKGNFEKGIEYLQPLMNDISMYLAEKSLTMASAESSENKDEKNPDSVKKMSETFIESYEMKDALIEDATQHFALNDFKGGIESLSKIFDFKEPEFRRIVIEDELIGKWKNMPVMAVHIPRIQMYLEAAML